MSEKESGFSGGGESPFGADSLLAVIEGMSLADTLPFVLSHLRHRPRLWGGVALLQLLWMAGPPALVWIFLPSNWWHPEQAGELLVLLLLILLGLGWLVLCYVLIRLLTFWVGMMIRFPRLTGALLELSPLPREPAPDFPEVLEPWWIPYQQVDEIFHMPAELALIPWLSLLPVAVLTWGLPLEMQLATLYLGWYALQTVVTVLLHVGGSAGWGRYFLPPSLEEMSRRLPFLLLDLSLALSIAWAMVPDGAPWWLRLAAWVAAANLMSALLWWQALLLERRREG